MKIVSTFIASVYAFRFSDQDCDELERIFEEWEDPFYLYSFFEDNRKDISVSVEEAIEKVRNEAKFLRRKLIELTTTDPVGLKKLFKNLDNNEITPGPLSPQKAPARWLRLYALRIEENIFVITGGAIKLNGGAIAANKEYRMQDRPHTQKELKKINLCRDYLSDQGVLDADSFFEIIF